MGDPPLQWGPGKTDCFGRIVEMQMPILSLRERGLKPVPICEAGRSHSMSGLDSVGLSELNKRKIEISFSGLKKKEELGPDVNAHDVKEIIWETTNRQVTPIFGPLAGSTANRSD